ncbi:hypothetical protein TWF679_006610 [Orbilia oligospora]|uniref:Protein kinase domain-containing protein n=1 Tax=Orbilia oligospora TaxID=2813651 RepID=A0A8H8V967_ORBOL|nr:hypothetical protein TWF679_006610 [Orbilia oligospora]
MNPVKSTSLKAISSRSPIAFTSRMISSRAHASEGMTLRAFLQKCTIKRLPWASPGCRSAQRLTSAANPRYLPEFRVWSDFFAEIDKFFGPYLDKKFDTLIHNDLHWQRALESGVGLADESRVRDLVMRVLEEPCVQTIESIHGRRSNPLFRSCSAAVNIGSPDRVLTFGERGPGIAGASSRLVIEQETPWALPLRGVDIVQQISKYREDTRNPYLKSVHRLYGYMSINFLKYGILTTVESTRVLRRVCDDHYPEGILECSPEIDINGELLRSPLSALAYVACLIRKEGYMHMSMDPDGTWPESTRIIRLGKDGQQVAPIPGLIGNEGLDAREFRMRLDDVIKGSSSGSKYVTRGTIFVTKTDPNNGVPVVIKIYDLQNPNAAHQYSREIIMYDRLSPLQGSHVPSLYAHGTDSGGGFGIIVLEDCGESLQDEWYPDTRELARTALLNIHDRGVLHRDIEFRNITYNPKDNCLFPIRIVGLGNATSNPNLVTEDATSSELVKLAKL